MIEQWVIYDHPRDYPDKFVVRCWRIVQGIEPFPTPEVWLRDDLVGARQVVAGNAPDTVRLDRSPGDDPVIVEVWL